MNFILLRVRRRPAVFDPTSLFAPIRLRPRGWIGLGNLTYTFSSGESTLEVFDSLEQMRDKIPPQLYEIVARSSETPSVEDLDI